MGGFFSSSQPQAPAPRPPAPRPPAPRPQPAHQFQHVYQNTRSSTAGSTASTPRQSSYATAASQNQWNNPQENRSQHNRPNPQASRRIEILVQTRGPSLASAVFQENETCDWESQALSSPNAAYKLVPMTPADEDYRDVFNSFRKTAQKQLKVVEIKRVENPYLLGCYLLKRDEIKTRYGYADEELHFHGTKKCNLDSICRNNFDWRLHGDSIGNKFGKGVSFSPIANYSSHYCDNNGNGSINTMFLVRVIVANKIVGNKNMVLPEDDYDTAIKPDECVIVKFCDNEFYPEFVIYYTGCAIQNNVFRN